MFAARQKLPQPCVGFMKSSFSGPHGRTHHLGNLVVFVAQDVVQHEHYLVDRGQLFDRMFQIDAIDKPNRRQVGASDLLAWSGAFLFPSRHFLQRGPGEFFLAQVHEHDVESQTVQPS